MHQILKAVEVAVEAEVARRLAVRERETAECVKAEKKRPSEFAQVTDSRMTQSRSKSPEKVHGIPSGVLTPLLKCHMLRRQQGATNKRRALVFTCRR